MIPHASSLVLATGLSHLNRHSPSDRRTDAPASVSVPPEPGVRVMSDEELLDLFPDTPVALATIDGKQRLIFLRPGDEERFLRRF